MSCIAGLLAGSSVFTTVGIFEGAVQRLDLTLRNWTFKWNGGNILHNIVNGNGGHKVSVLSDEEKNAISVVNHFYQNI